MSPVRPASRRGVVTVTAVVAALTLAACDSGASPAPSTAASTPTTTAAPGTTAASTTTVPSTPPSSGPPPSSGAPTGASSAHPVTSGPATPTAPPGSFAVAVAGAGQVTYPVSGVRCAATTVTGTATPAAGGPPRTLTLDTRTGTLTVAGLAPLDGTRLTGTVAGAPAAGVTLRWTGDATGSAASLTVTCP